MVYCSCFVVESSCVVTGTAVNNSVAMIQKVSYSVGVIQQCSSNTTV